MNTTINHRANEKVMAKRLLSWFSEELMKKDKSKMSVEELISDTERLFMLRKIASH